MIRFALAASLALAGAASAQTAVPSFSLPASNQLSDEAKVVLAEMRQDAAPPEITGNLQDERAFYRLFNDRRLTEMRELFRTIERRETMNGVGVDIVEPKEGVSRRNGDRVLINVHGGAFKWGDGSGALVEAIPIAATMGVRVVAVDYRLAPEHRYPSVSMDVAAVYRKLLETYPAGNIGIYGCSAGGIATAQAVSWIRKEGLPSPGAIGTLCGTGAPLSGDSAFLAGPLTGGQPLPVASLPDILPLEYMMSAAPSDPLAYPLNFDSEIRAMPPTLLLAGSRDYTTSALTLAHRRLASAGVESELYIFDGLPHAFFVWPDMPESIEAYERISAFFDDNLGVRTN